MSRLDNLGEILDSYEGRKFVEKDSEDCVVFNGEQLLRTEYAALEKILEPAGIKDPQVLLGPTRIEIENQNVVYLNIEGLPLKQISYYISDLKELRFLDFAFCQLKGLPEALLGLGKLEKVCMDSYLAEDPVAKELKKKGVRILT